MRNLGYQAFLYKDDWNIVMRDQGSLADKWINASLNYQNRLFDSYVKGGQEIALAKALITGDRSDLDRDLVQAYSNAGVVHIMSISGLHIGLIYIFLIQLIKVIPFLSKNKIIKAIVVLSGIWFFSILTGCSPPVMRSALMFTCLHFGSLINRKTTTYNFWSASAFALLSFDPMLLWDVGFQLSYTAVLGILVAQRPIYHWIIFNNKIVDYCWQLVSVSLAAQLFTLPVCIYYFHQVPLLFLVANMIAIPLSSIGLWLSLVLVMTGWLPLLPAWTGFAISNVYKWLNDFINYMDSLAFTVWNGIHMDLTETLLFLLIIVFLTQWLLRRSKPAFRASAVCCFLLCISFANGYWRVSHQHRMIVYNVNGATAIDIFSGKQYSEIFEGNDKNLSVQMALAASRQYFGAKTINVSDEKMLVGENEFYPGVMIVRSAPPAVSAPKEKIPLKAIVLSNAHKVRISDLNNFFDAGIYIFSPLNKRYEIEKWKKECEDLHLRSHDVSVQGAIVMDF